MNGMTGLETIEYMKQGGTAFYVCKITGRKVLTEIKNGNIYWCFECELKADLWHKECSFDFYQTYYKYIEPKLTGWERVDENERYYMVDSKCYVETIIEEKCMEDKYYYEDANYFSTEEKAEEINFKQTLFRKLQRFSDENGGSEIDWNDEHQKKYFIYYVHDRSRITTSHCYQHHYFGQIHFSSEEVAKQAIELFHDDLIKYFTM